LLEAKSCSREFNVSIPASAFKVPSIESENLTKNLQ